MENGRAKKKDHWVRWCPVFFLVGQLVVGKQWRCFSIASCCSEDVAAFSVGVHILFHMRRQVIEKGGLAHSIIVATADVHRTVASIAEFVRSDLRPIHCRALGVTAAYRPEKGCLADRVVELIAPMPLALAAALAYPHRLVATTGDVIASQTLVVGGTRDPALTLMMQQHDEVWGTANAELPLWGGSHTCCSHPSHSCGGTGSLWFVALW